MKSRSLQRAVAVVLIAAAAWFVFASIASNWQALQEHDWQLDPPLLAISLVAHVAVLVWGVFVWSLVLRLFAGPAVGWSHLLRIWFLSNLAKYIPGKIFQFIAVAQLARGADLPAATLLTSLLVHTGLALLSALVLSGFTIGAQMVPGVSPLALGTGLALAAAVFVHPAVLNRAIALVGRLSRRELLGWRGSWPGGILLLLLSVGSWVLYGAAFYLFLISLTPLPAATLPLLAGVHALSFVAGYMAIVTPGGLGVREAAMTALLLPILPVGVAALLAVASRLWTIAAEVIGGLAVLLLARGTDRRDRLSGPGLPLPPA